MEKQFVIFDIDLSRYYTGRYYEGAGRYSCAWSGDIKDAEHFKNIESIEELLNTKEDDRPDLWSFIQDLYFLEVKTIFVKSL